MAACRTPGPTCQSRNPVNIEDGTLARLASPRPASLGITTTKPSPKRELNQITVGGGVGVVHFIEGKSGFTVKGQQFIITGTPKEGMSLPPGGSSSYFFVYKKSNPNKMYRLDYDTLKSGAKAGEKGWEHNQKGVAEILELNVVNHQPAGSLASIAGTTVKVLRYGGRALLVVAIVDSALDIYYAPDKNAAIAKEAGGWAGTLVGAELGGEGGAAVGGGIGAFFFGAGAVPGAAIGAFVGSIVGGIGGYIGGKALASFTYHKLTEEEEWVVVSEAAAKDVINGN